MKNSYSQMEAKKEALTATWKKAEGELNSLADQVRALQDFTSSNEIEKEIMNEFNKRTDVIEDTKTRKKSSSKSKEKTSR